MTEDEACALIHERLAGSPLAGEFLLIQQRAQRVPLVGSYDGADLVEELEYQLSQAPPPAEDFYGEADECRSKIERVRAMTDREVAELHYAAGDRIVEALPQSPISYVLDEIPAGVVSAG